MLLGRRIFTFYENTGSFNGVTFSLVLDLTESVDQLKEIHAQTAALEAENKELRAQRDDLLVAKARFIFVASVQSHMGLLSARTATERI